LHVLTRADCTTRNRNKAAALQRTYDTLEERIARLAAQEEINRIRPDLDGNEIMTLLGIGPGPVVGRAWKHLLEVRLDEGPQDKDLVRAELLRWWKEQAESGQ
jgi:poly(A) polymerase